MPAEDESAHKKKVAEASDLNALFKRLNAYFVEHRVVSEDEIAEAVSVEVDQLDAASRKRLEEKLHGDPKKTLVESIVKEPTSVYSPNLTSKRNYLGETFYHYPTHDFLADELAEAFKRLAGIRAKGKQQPIAEAVVAFLKRSGYAVEEIVGEGTQAKWLLATKPERKLTVLIVSSINVLADLSESMDESREYAVVVPTEKTPAPFIQFCQDKVDEFAGKKLQIWVVDPDKKTVNPFLGYTHDDEIFKNFENPKVAAFACRMYGVGKDMWVRPY